MPMTIYRWFRSSSSLWSMSQRRKYVGSTLIFFVYFLFFYFYLLSFFLVLTLFSVCWNIFVSRVVYSLYELFITVFTLLAPVFVLDADSLVVFSFATWVSWFWVSSNGDGTFLLLGVFSMSISSIRLLRSSTRGGFCGIYWVSFPVVSLVLDLLAVHLLLCLLYLSLLMLCRFLDSLSFRA